MYRPQMRTFALSQDRLHPYSCDRVVMALRQGIRSSVSKAKSAPVRPTAWVLSTKGTTTAGSNDTDTEEREFYQLNNGRVFHSRSEMEAFMMETREEFWTNVFNFSSEVFDHSRPGPSVWAIYKSLRSGEPLEYCLHLKPPTASDYPDPSDDSDEDSLDGSHDEDSYSESEDYGVPVPEDRRGDRQFLRCP